MNVVRTVLFSSLVSFSVAAQTTGVAGSSAQIQLGQPSLGLTQVIALAGTYPTIDANQGSVGMMHTFGFDFAPNNALKAEGQLLAVQTNTTLFSLLGADYGGNGAQNFALPDLRGRFLVANGTGPGLPMRMHAQTFGSPSTVMSPAMPLHSHLMADGVRMTGVSGGGGPIDIHAATLSMQAFIMVQGVYPSTGGFTEHPFIGEIRWFAPGRVPENAMPCDGRVLQISQYQTLYSIVGTTYGGNGTTTFALPDLRGRVAVGTGQGPGLQPVALGQTWGSPTVNLTLGQLPMHTHTVAGEGPTQVAGGSQPFSVSQPSLGVTWLVATTGVFPPRNSGNGSFDEYMPVMGELVAFAGNFAPRGFALANGDQLAVAQNQALFSLIGINFGGNGSTNFNLPDLRGRTPIGTAAGSVIIGQTMGTPTMSLVTPQLTGHMHSYTPVMVVDAGVPDAGVVVDAGVPDAGMTVDAGTTVDAGVEHDAGVVVDAGSEEDAGVEVDAGTEEDAGVEVDAGVEEDAGVVADAGTEEDAGVETDAGTEVDAGVIADAGTEVRDAGMQMTDGGDEMPIDPMEPGGCGCTSGSSSTVLLGALAMFLRMRRRSRS